MIGSAATPLPAHQLATEASESCSGAGCHLNRDTAARIEAAGFDKVDLIRFSVPELSIIGPHIAGIATAPSS